MAVAGQLDLTVDPVEIALSGGGFNGADQIIGPVSSKIEALIAAAYVFRAEVELVDGAVVLAQ